ncbi:hypothetical protein [Sediminicola luteus]|uniref:TonB C-terminal domain-containing protein n=1 Tax=Sediminicola luteus TaxID=319238 RepID=A0A2A4GDQ0_9FLAO|nr:hypothetical protein [Sediminicola luteus]PCE66114.1 hypothetical protein B7P33_02100 [Sediminicola luteus]
MNLRAVYKGICLAGLMWATGCHYFVSKEKRVHEQVVAELLRLNLDSVDQYPLFEACDELAPKTEQKVCFEQTLLAHLSESFSHYEFLVTENVHDTLTVIFKVDSVGTVSLLKLETNARITDEVPEFDGIVEQSLKVLPRIQPAIKKGIPVSAKFSLPLVVNTRQHGSNE